MWFKNEKFWKSKREMEKNLFYSIKIVCLMIVRQTLGGVQPLILFLFFFIFFNSFFHSCLIVLMHLNVIVLVCLILFKSLNLFLKFIKLWIYIFLTYWICWNWINFVRNVLKFKKYYYFIILSFYSNLNFKK